jgi:hypothetical protein
MKDLPGKKKVKPISPLLNKLPLWLTAADAMLRPIIGATDKNKAVQTRNDFSEKGVFRGGRDANSKSPLRLRHLHKREGMIKSYPSPEVDRQTDMFRAIRGPESTYFLFTSIARADYPHRDSPIDRHWLPCPC